MALTITSPAFATEHEIPSDFTCEGADISPALAWSGVPAGTKTSSIGNGVSTKAASRCLGT